MDDKAVASHSLMSENKQVFIFRLYDGQEPVLGGWHLAYTIYRGLRAASKLSRLLICHSYSIIETLCQHVEIALSLSCQNVKGRVIYAAFRIKSLSVPADVHLVAVDQIVAFGNAQGDQGPSCSTEKVKGFRVRWVTC